MVRRSVTDRQSEQDADQLRETGGRCKQMKRRVKEERMLFARSAENASLVCAIVLFPILFAISFARILSRSMLVERFPFDL